ncbi:NAD(+) synthase [Xanthovirga aplysinae]|uniref:NAD(+) synthase n=1 Tax=Xanthovirga aplysinae TaxID=2529853 RepID=UPI0012BBB2F8|nr:NAD(+) synthase [Xanthovirga aplysinae]MTI30999.1 NAD(+) synthase [Xanthovirga aplysinae]
MKVLKIAAATVNQTPLNWEENQNNLRQAIKKAKEEKVDILCFPELCITAYGCEDLFLSDWLPQKALQTLLEIKEECQGIAVSLGLPFRFKNKLYNCNCLIFDREIQGFTAKQYLANEGVHYEPRWFTPWTAQESTTVQINGNSYPFGDLIYEIKGTKVAFEICEDAWKGKEERPACHFHHKEVELILNSSASHFAFGKSELREKLVIDSSEDYQCTYVFANLLGNEAGRMVYDGDLIIAQNGRLIRRDTRLSFQNFRIVYADINFSQPEKTIAAPDQDPKDKNTEFAKASSLALFDYMRKSHSKGFVLSLSGGADSSCCAVLVAEMVRRGIEELGIDKFLEKSGMTDLKKFIKGSSTENGNKKIVSKFITCAYQGTKNSSFNTFNAAKELADSLGASFHSWIIDEEVSSYTHKIEKAIGRELEWTTDDLALQNIQARARSPIIWMLTNIKNALLLTTSNRSEGDVGYATMDGDTSGSIAPIGAVDKYFVLNWLQWAEKTLHYKGLKLVNNLQPSAELRPLDKEQTDEDDLMPYAILVAIEKLAIRKHRSPIEVFETLNALQIEPEALLKEHISRFYKLWSRNQWKRERFAPSFHLDDYNVDPRTWCRFPILSGSFQEELKELMNNEE